MSGEVFMSLKKFRLPGRNEKSSVSFVTAGLYLRFQRLGISFIYLEQMLLSATTYYIAQHVYMALCCVYTGMRIYWGSQSAGSQEQHKLLYTSCLFRLLCAVIAMELFDHP
jgi:hypothetical protein